MPHSPIQRSMLETAWPGGVDVRVRIGLHRGRPTLTETGYVGLSVHTAARICSAAHGGQIVVSSAVRTAVLPSLADGVSLRRLGAWRFQGLREPEELYQVAAADLRGDFPPLRGGTRGSRPRPGAGPAPATSAAAGSDLRRFEGSVRTRAGGGRRASRCRR